MSEKIENIKLSDLVPDSKNANKGTARGRGMLEKSLQNYGAGRSILIDKHNRIIAGNKTAETAGAIGLDNVRIIETDGREIIAVKRTDLDLQNDKRARELAFADNRVAQVSLDWEPEQIKGAIQEGCDLSGMFDEKELSKITGTDGIDGEYTKKIESPVYEPKNEKPEMSSLFNLDKYNELLEKIKNSGVSEQEKRFLEIAASRHIIFDYSKCADFYAHSSPEVQDMMEDSALVIIDFEKALKLGYVELDNEVVAQYSEEYPDE